MHIKMGSPLSGAEAVIPDMVKRHFCLRRRLQSEAQSDHVIRIEFQVVISFQIGAAEANQSIDGATNLGVDRATQKATAGGLCRPDDFS